MLMTALTALVYLKCKLVCLLLQGIPCRTVFTDHCGSINSLRQGRECCCSWREGSGPWVHTDYQGSLH